jgi:soluble lytic murein transglycosylase-like protein
MWRFCLAIIVMALATAGTGRAQTMFPAAAAPGLLCRSAVAAAERGNGIPAHLLAAIARVESGRRDPTSGAVHPWPWTANAEGQGFFYETKAEAVAAVRAMQARGIQSIDIGCGQVNLMHHPDAFPSLEAAFDPQTNAAYAGKFLKELFAQSGDWNKAAGGCITRRRPNWAPNTERGSWPSGLRNSGLPV